MFCCKNELIAPRDVFLLEYSLHLCIWTLVFMKCLYPQAPILKNPKISFYGWGLTTFPALKKKGKVDTQFGDGVVAYVSKKARCQQKILKIFGKIKRSTQMHIFFHLSNQPQITVYLTWEILKSQKNKNEEE